MNLLLKISLLTCLLAAVSLKGGAQENTNLVINPSFEDTVQCPTGSAEIQQAIGWDAFRESPDYFNSCASIASYYSVPSNGFGYQKAASGNAYAGIICFNNSFVSNREIIGGSLTNPLSIGQKYFVTFKVNRPNDTSIVGYSSNKLGVKLSTFPQTNLSIDNTALFYTNSIIADTVNWTTISGSFIADSAYQYLMLGNFFDDANTTVTNNGTGPYAYYFVDDVCLSTDSLLCANFSVSVEENSFKNQFSIFPNPASHFVTINTDLQTDFNVEIYNTVGQLLYAKQNVNTGNLQLDISQYNTGLLFIKITSQNKQLNYKLLKQ